MRVLIVDDDRMFGEVLSQYLVRQGFAVDWIRHAQDVIPAMNCSTFDCIVLDLGLPDGDGAEVLRAARAHSPRLGSLVISGRRLVKDRVEMLDLGADDYLVKPVDLDEASARIRSVIRRADAKQSLDCEIRLGPLCVVSSRREVTWDGKPVDLTNREYWLLETFIRNKGQVLSRSRLEQAIYGGREEIGSNAVEVHIHNLRRKLAPELIVSIRGFGYHLGLGVPNG